MPAVIDLTSEAALSTVATQAFLNDVKRNLGFDPDTADYDLPFDLQGLVAECVATCEREQWRFILRKPVTLSLPYRAFRNADKLLFLPYGKVTALTSFTYLKTDGTTTTVSASSYSLYAHEPSKLWADDWTTVLAEVDDKQPYPITLTYTTGYSSHSEVPKTTLRALKILAYHLFEYRDAVSEGTVSELPQGYCQLRDLALLNDHRAIKYVADDYTFVSPS
jgi:hypothetical protein